MTADDVRQAVRLAVATLHEGIEADWSAAAGRLEWDCWNTVEHLCDDLFAYAAQLGPGTPPLTDHIPFGYTRRHPGGPANTILADRDAGPAALPRVLEASGALLVAMVRTSAPDVRAYHPYGVSDPEGFAAMGIVETLVHTHDIAEGLSLPWEPPGDLCARVLRRLFPDVAAETDVDAAPWQALLWATGRTELPGRPRRTSWRWYGTPPHEGTPSVPRPAERDSDPAPR